MIYPLDSQLEPWVDGEALEAIEGDEGWKRAEVGRCIEEPWYWLVNYVWTIRKDEFTEGGKPEVLRFPAKDHLRVVFDRCFREPRLVIDKSRQMTLSWVLMAYFLYWLQFGKHEELVCQTKKEADVESLVERCHFMLNSQRYWLRPPFDYRAGKGGRLVVMDASGRKLNSLTGIPGGVGAGDQIRSRNPSRYFLDEAGFIDEFEDCRTNAEACSQDIKLVSTANAGDFELFVNDKLGNHA